MTDSMRDKLLRAKLGDLLSWTKPKIVETIGPYDPSVFESYDTARKRLLSSCAEKLDGYGDAEILILTGEIEADPGDLLGDWRGFESRGIARLMKDVPPWYAGGFGHPDHVADFDHWSKMASFTVHELLCLSVGVEPGSLDAARVRKLGKLPKDEFDKIWPALRFLVRRREQLDRRFPSDDGDRCVSPGLFLEWVDKVDFDAHPEFLRLLRLCRAGGAQARDAAKAPLRQDKREVDTIAKLFTAMAIQEYGYQPHDPRSPIPKEIAEIAASLGIGVSDDTVRKYLKIGASFLPEDWEPE